MKFSIIVGTSLAVLLSAGVVIADGQKSTEGNNTVIFQSMSSLPSDFTPMTDEALEATEGKGNACFFACGTNQAQYARINQHNHSFFSAGIVQNNTAVIAQLNSN